MNPEQLWRRRWTRPDAPCSRSGWTTRRLADGVFSVLMGDAVEPRPGVHREARADVRTSTSEAASGAAARDVAHRRGLVVCVGTACPGEYDAPRPFVTIR